MEKVKDYGKHYVVRVEDGLLDDPKAKKVIDDRIQHEILNEPFVKEKTTELLIFVKNCIEDSQRGIKGSKERDGYVTVLGRKVAINEWAIYCDGYNDALEYILEIVGQQILYTRL